ncbi:hypothetical protein ACFQ0I_17315 [Mariniflexile aquimaris]|uniref:Uncharacterized protein n=1 Tax=Mariniflexile aquimaris TaxID=881009 RepID=A0ABW3BWN0_9FLAO
MDIKGKYKKDVVSFLDCTVEIQNRKLNQITFDRDIPMIGFFDIEDVDFTLKRYYYKKNEFPIKDYKYALRFRTKEKTVKILLNLSCIRYWIIKIYTGKTLIQEKQVKIALLLLVLTNVISFVTGMYFKK